jgi:hypothetical protein
MGIVITMAIAALRCLPLHGASRFVRKRCRGRAPRKRGFNCIGARFRRAKAAHTRLRQLSECERRVGNNKRCERAIIIALLLHAIDNRSHEQIRIEARGRAGHCNHKVEFGRAAQHAKRGAHHVVAHAG